MFDFKFDWCKEMEVGIKPEDQQHQELFRIGREIEQLITHECIGVETKQLLDIVCELRDYVSYHFYLEEQLMEKYQYENYDEHKSAHDRFKSQIMSIDCKRLGAHPMEVLSETKILMQNWLFNHMLAEDHKMCEQIMSAYKQDHPAEFAAG